MNEGAVLVEAPATLWGTLAGAVHKVAHDTVHKAALPPALRPYASFRPSKLLAAAPRRAIVTALSGDARFREAVGAVLPKAAWTAAATATPGELTRSFSAEIALAVLAARARWDAVAEVVAAMPVPEVVRVADGDERPGAGARQDRDDQRRIAAAEKRAAQAERAADDAQRRARVALDDAAALRAELERLNQDAADMRARMESQRADHRDRLARARRRADDAEARARADARRIADVANALEALAAELRSALEGDTEPEAAQPDQPVTANAEQPPIPRTIRPAEPGRPAVLPPGVHADDPAAVHALLQMPSVAVIVDGYNVSKDLRGRPAADLADQRAWLETLLGGLVARYGIETVAVWDGQDERTKAASRRRGVRTVFTDRDETADERIVALVGATTDPVVVVSSDREVQDDTRALGANVIASGVFLRAVG